MRASKALQEKFNGMMVTRTKKEAAIHILSQLFFLMLSKGVPEESLNTSSRFYRSLNKFADKIKEDANTDVRIFPRGDIGRKNAEKLLCLLFKDELDVVFKVLNIKGLGFVTYVEYLALMLNHPEDTLDAAYTEWYNLYRTTKQGSKEAGLELDI